jgi:hypothetical protein
MRSFSGLNEVAQAVGAGRLDDDEARSVLHEPHVASIRLRGGCGGASECDHETPVKDWEQDLL